VTGTQNNCPAQRNPFVLLLKQAQRLNKDQRNIMSTKNEYMLLSVGNEWYNKLSAAEIKKVSETAKAWYEGLAARGIAKEGHGLARAGARITAKTGKVISDGPYAESKEAVGGYLIVQAGSMEEAIAIAKSCPTVAYGTTMEIREVNDDCPLHRRARELNPELTAAAA
jgi:hypothetical protein